ncbi:MAG: hypothetical protein U5K27_02430 [Desulfotignum sp.]|nr:hypothetical protein [Desulfotignum sp.]
MMCYGRVQSGIFGIVGRKDAVIKVLLPRNNEGTSEDDMEGIRSMVDEAFGQDTRLNSQGAPKKQDKGDDGQCRPAAPCSSNKEETTKICSETSRNLEPKPGPGS